jgi:hypothetical protein
MLDLDSERWKQLKSSTGGDGTIAARLLASFKAGDLSALEELQHQACHQLSVGDVAYAIAPHLVALAREAACKERVQASVIVGWVAAATAAYPSEAPPLPEDLRKDYEESLRMALTLALGALQSESLRPGQVTDLLGVVAALSGRSNVALHLLLHGGSDGELSCPECGEYIAWTKET